MINEMLDVNWLHAKCGWLVGCALELFFSRKWTVIFVVFILYYE
jgi:lipid-A-disaccharide synthase-like uncharacterized protein